MSEFKDYENIEGPDDSGFVEKIDFKKAERERLKIPNKVLLGLRLLRMRKFENSESLPPVPDSPAASEIAKYAVIDWDHIKHTKDNHVSAGQSMAGKLYEMAKLMSTREGYTGLDEEGGLAKGESMNVSDKSGDEIRVGEGWRVKNGQHRVLALKLLGEKFVEEKGMNEWVGIRNISRAKDKVVE